MANNEELEFDLCREKAALADEARRLLAKSWSPRAGQNFNAPPSPREMRAWMAAYDAIIARYA